MKYYLEEVESVLDAQNTTKNGLDESESRSRLVKYGKNKLKEGKKKSLAARFLGQISDPMIIILLIAGIISGAVGEIADTVIILTVVVLNSILGIVQEGKAEKAIEALQKMASPYSKVRRNKEVISIKSEEIVP